MNYVAIWTVLLLFSIGHCVNGGGGFNLLPNEEKCVLDRANAHELIVIKLFITPGLRFDYVIKGSGNKIFAKKEGMTRQATASFTSETSDYFDVCVRSRANQALKVSIDTEKGQKDKNTKQGKEKYSNCIVYKCPDSQKDPKNCCK